MSERGKLSASKFIQAIATITFFLFLPAHSRLAYFATSPDDWYGRISVQRGGEVVSVVKNVSATPILPEPDVGATGVARGLDLGVDAPALIGEGPDHKVPPRSVAFLFTPGSTQAEAYARLPDGRRFRVQRLYLLTQAERSLGALGIFAVIVLLVFLTFRSADYLRTERTSVDGGEEAADSDV